MLLYSDSEVNKFHPLCQEALNRALKNLCINDLYTVLHHQMTGNLEMDFCIQNVNTCKYLCVIEIKRTPNAVQSTRYQLQAMSYVQMNTGNNERDYYIISNLEYAMSFRYDAELPRPIQQLLTPGLVKICDFCEDDEEAIVEKLTLFYENILINFKNGDCQYLTSAQRFIDHIRSIDDRFGKKWKSNLAVLFYEYIRGALSSVNRICLSPSISFSNLRSMCECGAGIDFRPIFNYDSERFSGHISVSSNLRSILFGFGQQNIYGDFITNPLYEFVSNGNEHFGEVPTDSELADLVAVLAKHWAVAIAPSQYVCDPAAGSGNLISSAIKVFNLQPNQIKINDINSRYEELLSLRIGLLFIRNITPSYSPIITIGNIADLSCEYFENVKVVMLNPPFIAGISCRDKKQKLYDKLNQLCRGNIISMYGQMPYEVVFLELLLELVRPGTTIACVFPKNTLLAMGAEAKRTRKLLIDKFGLKMIFDYPSYDLFNSVQITTCVLVGKVKERVDKVAVISSNLKISDIDINVFKSDLDEELNENFREISYGINGMIVDESALINNVSRGWSVYLDTEKIRAEKFINDNFENNERFKRIADLYSRTIYRGSAGNSGGSDLIFVDTISNIEEYFNNLHCERHAALRSANLDVILVGDGDRIFFDINDVSEQVADNFIEYYRNNSYRSSRQARVNHTTEELRVILQNESSKYTKANSLLLPRAIRKTGKVYITTKPTIISTNFFVIPLEQYEDAAILASWMSSVFYQLNCELVAKDEQGLRKMEKTNILRTYIPLCSFISEEMRKSIVESISNIKFHDLNDVELNNNDYIWAKYLFGDNANNKMIEAKNILEMVVCRRDRP